MIDEAVTRTPATVRWTASEPGTSAAKGIAANETISPQAADDTSSSGCGRQIARMPSTTRTGTARSAGSMPATFAPAQTNPVNAIGKAVAAITPTTSVRAITQPAPRHTTARTAVVSWSLGSAARAAVV